jgi:hypothetical protein
LDFYKEVAPLIERLINYRLSLMKKDYYAFYNAAFAKFYIVPNTDSILFSSVFE